MKCTFCGVDMKPVGLYFANGWRCPECKHQEVDACSVSNWEDVQPCPCDRCREEKT